MLDEMQGIKNSKMMDKTFGSSNTFLAQQNNRIRFANSSGLAGDTQFGTGMDENLVSQSNFNQNDELYSQSFAGTNLNKFD